MSVDGDRVRTKRAIVEQTVSQLRALLDSEAGQNWLDDPDEAFEAILQNAQAKVAHNDAVCDAYLWGFPPPKDPVLVHHPFMLGDDDD